MNALFFIIVLKIDKLAFLFFQKKLTRPFLHPTIQLQRNILFQNDSHTFLNMKMNRLS